ncbi:acyl carrier protein [Streptomyces spongiae]|uniref:Acyl carrier protein n=1 Tax=Streptomyces spongiae TaxID=565072 RepID=A0A5N8XC14_9ACTN|nr:acyl carrier protein [Streptomyces spongiae]MPY56989.1 acyl carrier protein [Streptomyces spongiae]
MSTVRELLTELTGTSEYAEKLSDDTDLAASGIDSGDLVRLILLVEQHTGVEITAQDMEQLSTIADYERFLADRSGSAPQPGSA